jgi:hypothetical protein
MNNQTNHVTINTMDTHYYWHTYKDSYYFIKNQTQLRKEEKYVQ